jgi:arylsulfatase A-like enzyme
MSLRYLLAWSTALFLTATAAFGADSPPGRLNVVFILADDLGWRDLGCQGSTFYRTPNLDRLASQGMRFTQAYSACTVCSPTRASILTGKYPARLHITDWISGHVRPHARLLVPDWTQHLPLSEPNLARVLGPAGYATASIGKWHLGKEPFYPEKQGFDVNIGGCDRGQPPSYVSPYGIPTLADGVAGEFLTDRESLEAAQWIERNRDRPFFLYLASHAVHTPLMGKSHVVEKYRALAKADAPQHNAKFAALVEALDDGVGRVLSKIDELGLAERTVVVFTSDNGGLVLNQVTSNLPLRSGKGSPYEGGVRVPLLVRWPGVTSAGSVCDEPVISPDHYPTILEITGKQPPRGQAADGLSLVPLLRGKPQLERDAIFWHYPHYHPGGATPYGAIRSRDWKLIEYYEDGRVELFNLGDDLQESRELSAKEPARVAALRERLQTWRTQVGAQMPRINPDHNPARDAGP